MLRFGRLALKQFQTRLVEFPGLLEEPLGGGEHVRARILGQFSRSPLSVLLQSRAE